jgi:hypothetical protein
MKTISFLAVVQQRQTKPKQKYPQPHSGSQSVLNYCFNSKENIIVK